MDFKQRMTMLLKQLPDAKLASGGSEIVLRCRYCGDSQRNHSDRHMYVKLPDYKTPMLYNCYRANCRAKGIVTYDKLIQWGIDLTDEDIQDIINYNKNVLKMDNNKILRDRDIYILNNRYINKDKLEFYNKKISYINNRLGTSLTHEDLKQLKITLDVLETINENNLGLNMELWKLNILSNNSIGFITQDNVYAVCRNIYHDSNQNNDIKNFRYMKYKLHNILNDNRESFYIIPTNINIDQTVKIYLSEGTFDILSIYFNIPNNYSNSIYCAVLGAGYERAVKYFISTLKLINIEFHFYLDNDMDTNKLNRLLYKLRPYEFNIYFHHNTFGNEKDFGVSKDKIIDTCTQVSKGW